MASATNTVDIVRQLAARGVKRIDIETALGRPFTKPERAVFSDSKPKSVPKTGQERLRKFRKAANQIEMPPVEDQARRDELEKNPEKWLRHYMAACYPAPFSAGHKVLIKNTVKAARTGKGVATAQPRGEGKTTVLRGLGIYLNVIGLVKFLVLVGWKHSDAKMALDIWLNMLSDSPEFAADYPEICTPFIHSTHKTALANLTWGEGSGDLFGERTGAGVQKDNKVIILPNSLGVVAARSAQGDAKGLQVQVGDGSIMRPDFLLFDDAQDTDRAGNPLAVQQTIDKIENVFMGMGGPQNRIISAAACTIEAEDDVSCYWLRRPDFRTNIVSRIAVWPDGTQGGTWEDKEHPVYKMWQQWHEIYIIKERPEANKFFREHRKEMTGEMCVSWAHRYKKGVDVCAIDCAMFDWFRLGEDVFARGQQNMPLKKNVDVYTITPAIVRSRTDGRKRHEMPEWVEFVTASADINPAYGLTWIITGFGKDQTAAVLDYGIYDRSPIPIDDNENATRKSQLIYQALTNLGRDLKANPCKPTQWIIDAGGAQSGPVKIFALNSMALVGLPVICSYGRAGKTARLTSKYRRRVGEEWMQCREVRNEWLIFNADYWREVMQKAFTCETGAAGGCTLPSNMSNIDFANQICNEKLQGKAMVGDRMVWDFVKTSGRNDYADALVLAYLSASVVANIGTGGLSVEVPKRKKYRSG